jgi:very-short-patch-repair endonuclease
MSQAFVSVKNLAAYCLDYARLVTPILARSSAQTDVLGKDILDCSPLLTKAANEELLLLPFTLDLTTQELVQAEKQTLEETPGTTNKPGQITIRDITAADEPSSSPLTSDEHSLREYPIKPDMTDSKGEPHTSLNSRADERNLHVHIAQQLEDLNRKYQTASFTKQLQLECGFVSFRAKHIVKEAGVEKVAQPLFSIPVQLVKTDKGGKRSYHLEIADDAVTIDVTFLAKYLSPTYYDELFTFVTMAQSEGEGKNTLPLSEAFIDELWSKIKHFLSLQGAEDIAASIQINQSAVTIKPKGNPFLTQDLLALGELDEAALQNTSLAAWTTDEDMSINNPMSDDGQHEIFFPFPYDKWQLGVLGILDNKAAIVEGPPGTGKSQTIANILSHLAAQGKKVLFVSQKDQAIRGVKDKLKTLDIPFMFGYIPDRNSPLHTEQDEKDSASHTLTALSREWPNQIVGNPLQQLQQSAATKPVFGASLETERKLYTLYEELATLATYNFGDAKLSHDWWQQYTHANLAITKKQRVLEEFHSKHTEYIAQHDQRYQLLEADAQQVYETIKQAIVVFDKHAFDRSGLKRTFKDLQLKQAMKRVTSVLPNEIFTELMGDAFAEGPTKAERKSKLLDLHNYFVYRYEQAQLQHYVDTVARLVGEAHISIDELHRLEQLINAQPAETVFANIEQHTTVVRQIRATEKLNTNELRRQIATAQQHYQANVATYIRNRLWSNAQHVRSLKAQRAILERIAHSLAKSKRAYKTFDRLKSNPYNFAAMSEVVPIWMMSLDDASRVLPMQQAIFDYVIIDEASQCNIAFALPVMYRTRHTIFFGDSLQMRDSTTLFKTNDQLNAIALKHGISEDYQIKASEDSVKSVMDIGKLAGFQPANLKYHYRSPQQLIGFSNEYIYKKHGRALEVINDTVLTYKDTGRVMVNHVVQARPDMELSAKTNIAEAYYIRQLVAELRDDPATADKSIAVLAFFNEQAELIRRVVEDEDVKVSIIDGIQGDERDIIIYSFVISSPDQKNRYVALTSEGGEMRREANEGRINVAFSRAKLQVHAVTSLQPHLWPEGIWIKKYLDYIEAHGTVTTQHIVENQQFDSDFEEQVYRYLAQLLPADTYSLTTQVQSCGFRIDLVIHHKKTGKRLAIECDGPTHFEPGDGQVYVTNDFERQSILETAGWQFYRIPYHEWHEQLADTQRSLLAYLGEHFEQKPLRPQKQEADATPIRGALPVTQVDIPEEFVIALRQAKPSKPTTSS